MILKLKNMLPTMCVAFSFVFVCSCAESNSTQPAPMNNASLPDDTVLPDTSTLDTNFTTQTDANRTQTTADLYIPPPPADMFVDMSEPVELTLRRCVQRMLDYLDATRVAAGCNDTPVMERSDPGSAYARVPVTAACIQLECTGLPLDGHNGIPTTKSCKGLDNLIATLEVAEEDANAGVCGTPVFQVKVISLDDFAGPEPCDALICGLEADGAIISVDQRD